MLSALVGNANAEENGFLLGVSAGGGAALALSSGGGVSGSSTIVFGLKTGYQVSENGMVCDSIFLF